MELQYALYILIIIFTTSAQTVLKKSYSNRVVGAPITFSAVSALAACIFFLARCGFRVEFGAEVLSYAIAFGCTYSITTVSALMAINEGPISLTSLVTSYSLIIPTLYGLIFDKESAGGFFFLGLLLLVVSIFLINAKKTKTKITPRWALYAGTAFVCNGIGSVVQTAQSARFSGRYDSSFMVIALTVAIAVLFSFVVMRERKKVKSSLKTGALFMIGAGAMNGVCNLFVMITAAVVNKSLMFPLISAGGIVLAWMISLFGYKEKLTARQTVGMILGVASIVFLNL